MQKELFDNVVQHRLFANVSYNFEKIRKGFTSDWESHILPDLDRLCDMIEDFKKECYFYIRCYSYRYSIDDDNVPNVYYKLYEKVESLNNDIPCEMTIIEKSIENMRQWDFESIDYHINARYVEYELIKIEQELTAMKNEERMLS